MNITMIKDIAETLMLLRKLHFYALTLLWVTALVTWLIIPGAFLFPENELLYIPAFRWITAHEEYLMRFLTFYYSLFTCTLLICIVNYLKIQDKRLWTLTETLWSVGFYLVLLMQLLHNFGITQYGMFNQYEYLEAVLPQKIILFFPLAGYMLTILMLVLLTIGYLYQQRDSFALKKPKI